jgi:prepilin-type N-terminal cleavage/methylation domain-containing protein
MKRKRPHSAGFTLVEMIVVIAIIALLSSLVIPGMARLGVFSRNELQNASREVFALLRAARIYASTFNVDTAVVYTLDNYWEPPVAQVNGQSLPEDGYAAWRANSIEVGAALGYRDGSEKYLTPVNDSITGNTVRVITAAAVMYELPAEQGGRYVPVPYDEGQFTPLPGGMVIFLRDPGDYSQAYYADTQALFNPGGMSGLADLGMNRVNAYITERPDPPPLETMHEIPPVNTDFYETGIFPAHIFTPSGYLDVMDGEKKERYTIYLGPSPTETRDVRLINPDVITGDAYADISGNLVSVPIHLFRSTGKIKIAS